MSETKKKRSVLPEKEKKISQQLDDCYKFLSVVILWGTLVFLVVALVLDFVPCPYCCTMMESFFCNGDASPLISTSLVIWTFGATLTVYFMGRMEDRRFGIRFYEALLAHESKANLTWKILLFLAEVVLLEFSAAYDLPITLFVVCVLQPVNIVYFFLMITREVSSEKMIQTITIQTEAVLKQMGEQQRLVEQPCIRLEKLTEVFNRERKNWLLFKALRGINYNSHDDMDDLQSCLPTEQWKSVWMYPEVQLVVSWNLACFMLDAGRSSTEGQEKLPVALIKLFAQIVGNPYYPGFVKVGILTALIIHEENGPYDKLFLDLLEITSPDRQVPVSTWCAYFLKRLVESNQEDFNWRKTLLDDVNDFRGKDSYPSKGPGTHLIDGYLAWLGFIMEEENSLTTDLEKEAVGCVRY